MARSQPPRAADREREVGPRRQAREAALQVLYGLDASGEREAANVMAAINAYWAHLEGPAAGRAYADELVRKVMAGRDQIDGVIRAANPTWRVERMARVDRNILRVAVCELREGDDVPAAIVIDEAVELAKQFGTEESAAFVNGTLDKVARDLGRLGSSR